MRRGKQQGRCKGIVKLNKVVALEYVDPGTFSKRNMFQIVHETILYIQAADEAEREDWLHVLRSGLSHEEGT